MSDLRDLIDQWELVGNKQREIARAENDVGLRASLLATSNAWMTAASDLKKHLEGNK